jgi:methionine sulfoxide reductase catalytic subunit
MYILRIPPSEITSEHDYVRSRRVAIRSLGLLTLAGATAPHQLLAQPRPAAHLVEAGFAKLAATANQKYKWPEPVSTWQEIASYGLYHEFGEGNTEPMNKAQAIHREPWTISVEGEVRRPKVWGVDELLKLAPLEERIYRHRCVGGWYMVVPWVGYSLAELIRQAEPTGNAKYVEFTSHWDEKIMGNAYYRFPYIESLRLDEAMNPLTLLCSGHHGRVLPKQNGAPLRIITPWKFAHKSPKAIVKIRFTEQQPAAFFYTQYPNLYGWYRNVHPELAQGGSQRREKRVSQWFRSRDTPLMNGYAEQVAQLYGSDLNVLR